MSKKYWVIKDKKLCLTPIAVEFVIKYVISCVMQ